MGAGMRCVSSKSEHVVSPGLLQPLLVPMKVWSKVTMDFIEDQVREARSDAFQRKDWNVEMTVDSLGITDHGHFFQRNIFLIH